MNILFQFDDPIIPSSGGVERVTDTLTRELKKRGHNIAYLCHQKMELVDEHTEQAAIQYYIDLSQNYTKTLNDIQNIINTHKTEFIITQNPNADQLDIAALFPKYVKRISVCHTQPYSFDSLNRKRISQIRPVNYKHQILKCIGLLCPCFYKLFLLYPTNKIFKRAIRESDRYCFISSKFFPRIAKHISHIPQDKLIAIPNPNTFKSSKNQYMKEKLVLWVGRIENNGKNALGFIKMWRYFIKNNPDWNAIIIGDGPDLQFDKNYVLSKNIPNIKFTGKINNVQEYYCRASFVVVTSWSESWSMVLTEGMSMGCIPCVYNTYETLSDIIDDDVNGLIINKISPQQMAIRLSHTVKDKEAMEKISIAALEKVKSFDVQYVADQWEKLLKSIP